jgi:hypothetical protein
MEGQMPQQLHLPGFPAPAVISGIINQRGSLLCYPNIPSATMCSRAKELGQACEALVDSVLLRLGITSTDFGEHSPFDRMIVAQGHGLALQVKGRHVRDDLGYRFDIRKGYHRSPQGARRYAPDEFHLLALVALPHNVVKFVAMGNQSHVIRNAEIADLLAHPGKSLTAALESIGIFPEADGFAPF